MGLPTISIKDNAAFYGRNVWGTALVWHCERRTDRTNYLKSNDKLNNLKPVAAANDPF